ncbi:MAG: ATP-binding protein [Desulfohalobiaceae bacterium]
MSFRLRIFWWFALLIVLALAVLYLVFSSVLKQEITSQTRDSAMRYLRHINWLLQQEIEVQDQNELQRLLREIGQGLNLRVTYIDDQGWVLADSGLLKHALAGVDNHAKRPEIQQAMQEGTGQRQRYSDTLQTPFLYVAMRIPGMQQESPAVLRVAMPTAQIESTLHQLQRQFALLVLGLLVLCAGLSWLISRRMGHEIRSLGQQAEAIGYGDLQQRMESVPGKDFQPLVQSINRMAKRVQSALQEVSERRDELETLLNGLQDAVFVLDFQGKAVMYNQALQDLAGKSAAIRNREPIEFLRSPDLQEACTQALQQPGKGTRRLFLQLQQRMLVDASIIPVRLQDKDERRVIVVLHDVTELKKMEQVRRDFVANVSHELRTPLTALKGYAESLIALSEEEQQQKQAFLQVILKNADQMNRLLDNLLQLAGLEAGSIDMSSVPVDVGAVLEKAWEDCFPLAEEKDICLESNIVPGEVWVLAQEEHLRQVWVNLVHNALKYSPAGSCIQAWAQEQDREWLLALQDQGPGIPAAHQERIFERFYRGEPEDSGRERQPGSGLGLAICRHILASHKGRIWVQSPARDTLQGTVFFFSLPRGSKPTDALTSINQGQSGNNKGSSS